MPTRRRFSAEFKAKVAIEALKGQQTVNEIASAHGIHPNQVVAWKKQLLSGASDLFGDRRVKDGQAQEELTDRLYQQIGQLKVELDWLKKKSGLGS
jgi:putative transposase